MTENVALDARLLSNALIELNIARHILSLYSREHQLVQLSLDKTFAILSDLFELRSEITMAVAKDSLVIDGRQLDPKNPVFREFALALSRMSVALISFVKGLTREEVYDLFRFLSRDTSGISSETLPQILAEYGLRHIRIEPVDFRAFTLAESRMKRDGSDEYLLERYIKALVDGDLPADGVQAVVENVEPGTLAVLMNQAGSEITRKESYDTVVSSYLRGGAGKPVTGGDLQRLLTFIAGLRPELKQQFLNSSLKAISGEPAALNHALEEVAVDSIIEFISGLDRAEMKLPTELGTLIARFSRTGVELPGGGLNVDDVLLSPEVAGLFKQDESHLHGPESYEAEIRRVVEAPAESLGAAAGAELAHELDEDYVRYCHANALLALLDSQLPGLVTLEDEEAYAGAFNELATHSVRTGQYAQLLELLTRFQELEARGRHRATVRAVREHCHDPEFVSAIADSLRRHGRANRAGAAMVCAYYGSEIVPSLFELLAVEERMHVRKLLLQLLIGLGARAVEEAQRQFRDGRWHVRRNALYILAESGLQLDPGLLEPLCGDRDPRVRLECARCLVLSGSAEGAKTLRALLLDPAAGVADAAIAIAGALGLKELLPELAALARRPSGSDGPRQRLRAVRALGQIGGEQAAAALQSLLTLRISLFPGETKRFRGEVRKMLRRIAERQPQGEAPPDGAAGGAA